ncbi:hypothetical protein D3C75_1012340 [compost metagenome]
MLHKLRENRALHGDNPEPVYAEVSLVFQWSLLIPQLPMDRHALVVYARYPHEDTTHPYPARHRLPDNEQPQVRSDTITLPIMHGTDHQ